ncbi:hypothetical protein C0993_008371 [Termitomyces sp. T159_Od127]|nr:hypothetical protein C0993_008371 [Termitomyces sp. T159_Od127]
MVQEVMKELVADVQQHIAKNLEALAWKGLGLGEATVTGKRSWQGVKEGQGAREKAHKDTAGAAPEVVAPVTPRTPAGGAKG